MLIFCFAFIYGYRYSKALLIDGAEKEATLLTRQTIARLENVINPAEVLPQTLADAMETRNLGIDQVIGIARTFVSNDPAVFGSCLAMEPGGYLKDQRWYATYLFEKDHQITIRNIGNKEYDYFTMDWYRLPKLLNRPVWTEPYFDKGGGDVLMCTYSTPFYVKKKETRQFGGVITMDISLLALERTVKQIKLFKTGYGFLVSAGGMVISSPKLVMENKNVLEIGRIGRGKQTQMALKAMLDGKSGFTAMDGLDAQVHPSFLAYAPLSSTGWSLGIIFPEEDLMDDLYSFFRKILWILACSLLALLATTVLITRSLTRPIIHLVDATRQIGQGDFHSQLPVRKTRDEIMQLTSAFAVMQEELGNYILTLQTTMAKEKIESELQVAHTIQMGMLPRGFLTPGNWELFATLDPAKAVGGDLYDFFYPDPDHLCIAIGDVSGKGVPAALFMMVTRTLFRAKAVAGSPLSVVMESINRELCQDNPSQMFVTFFAGIVNLDNGEMVFCNAGHNYPYILNQDGDVRQLKTKGGLPLGVSSDLGYRTGSFFFSPGEIMVLTTDGITDALNVTDDFFGEANLTAALTARPGSSPRQLTESLISEVKVFSEGTEQADDITILALQYKEATATDPVTAVPVHLTLSNNLDDLEVIRTSLDKLAADWNIPLKIIMEVNLVLEELFTNVVFYSYDDREEHAIVMDFNLQDTRVLEIRIEDDGMPFNLLERKISDLYGKSLDEREVGGLGIHFVREIMTNVAYQRLDGKNVVILTKIF